MKHIVSRSNPVIKYLHGLAHHAQSRRKAGQTVLDGAHLIMTAQAAGWSLEALYVSESAYANNAEIKLLIDEVKREGLLPVVQLADVLFSYVSPVTTPSGILGVINLPVPLAFKAAKKSLVVLDGVQDPGNLGTLLRNTAAAGIRDVLLTSDCAHAWAPRVLRAGMGAHFLLNIHECIDPLEALTGYQGEVLVTALAGQARSLYALDLAHPVAWVFGGEGRGVSVSLLKRADVLVGIPIAEGVESLNVAAAAAVCLFEQRRQFCLNVIESA